MFSILRRLYLLNTETVSKFPPHPHMTITPNAPTLHTTHQRAHTNILGLSAIPDFFLCPSTALQLWQTAALVLKIISKLINKIMIMHYVQIIGVPIIVFLSQSSNISNNYDIECYLRNKLTIFHYRYCFRL